MFSGLIANDTDLLERFIAELAPIGKVDEAENTIVLARILVNAVERGIVDARVLRAMIASYRNSLRSIEALEVWDTEGGAAARP